MFQGKAFIPFVTAGHPDLETTRDVVLELARCGAGVVEIGIPFSDPIADGPVIQRSSFEALRHGYSLRDYLQVVGEVRSQTDVPLIFMTYLNPLLRYGLERLDSEGFQAGLTGVLISDLTPEETIHGAPVLGAFRKLKLVCLVAPTSSQARIAGVCSAATGFVYLVARTGVTGKQSQFASSLEELVDQIRGCTSLPVAVGFGIRSQADVRRVWEFADGAVVGSAIVAFMEEHRDEADLPGKVGRFVRETLLP